MKHTSHFAGSLAGIGLLCATQAALAQAPVAPATLPEVVVKPQPPKKKPAPEPVTSVPMPVPAPAADPEPPVVSVSAERPTNRIDRQVYDVKSDIASTNGTAADALNNVPSVAVDPDGTVTLRGSSNVQILVDGKPSAMMTGDNRGATLNAMGADDIESIEVINNPGAQFGNEAGGGPILNLVMRRNRKPGGFSSVNANAGTAGRYNSAFSGSYNEGLWGIQGGVNMRHDGRNSVSEASRDRLDPLSNLMAHSSQESKGAGLNDNAGFNSAVTYNWGPKDTAQVNLAYSKRSNDQHSTDHYINDNPDATVLSDYVRTTIRSGDASNYSWGGRLDHKGAIDGELLKLDLRVSSSTNKSDSAYSSIYAVNHTSLTDSQGHQGSESGIKIADFTGDYERPTESGIIKAGFKVAGNKNDQDVLYVDIDPRTLLESVNPLRTNHFIVDENNIALYASYQMRLGQRWGVLGGLRTEYTSLDMDQATQHIRTSNNYINYIPSFFATYKVSDLTNLRFAYAHRLRRPGAGDLNPFVIYRDELNVSSGNPKLKPTQTDSFEVGYESKLMGLDANLRGYFRKDDDAILDRKYFISNTVLLTTRDNGPGTRSGGLEFTLSGKLTPKMSLNASGNLATSQQRILDASGIDTRRTASSLSARVRLNYQATDDDHVQFALQTQGRTLAGQGYREPNTTLNFSVRHAVTPRLNLVLNMTDVFNSNKIETITNTSTLRELIDRRYDGRIVYFGLSYRMGGVTPGARPNRGGDDRGRQGGGQRGGAPGGAGAGAGPGGGGGQPGSGD